MQNNFFGFITFFLLATLSACGGGSSGTVAATPTRALTGTISEGSLSTAIVKSPNATKSLVKKVVSSCSEVQVCCTGYSGGDPTVADVASDCTFTLPLPLNTYCGCWLASGTDSDADGCGDDYIGSMGCSENKYQGLIPTGGDGAVTDIALGTATIEGNKVVTGTNACSQVDSDDDGTVDSEDADDDGDGTNDDDDATTDEGCQYPTFIDSNLDGIPDFFQPAIWNALTDSDGDGTPDFCDVTTDGCTADDDDTDGNCVPDIYDTYKIDDDADGYPSWDDCDDSDNTVTNSCYSDAYCNTDDDDDGFGLCDDCDDEDPDSTYECYGDEYCDQDEDGDGYGLCVDYDDGDATQTTQGYSDSFCEEDNDSDGFNICIDCNDFDDTDTTACYDDAVFCQTDADDDGFNQCIDCDDSDADVTQDCYSDTTNADVTCDSSTIACENDFQCQLFAEDDQTDDFETGNVACVEGCCEISEGGGGGGGGDSPTTEDDCDDSIDNDDDGDTDCDDSDCGGSEGCMDGGGGGTVCSVDSDCQAVLTGFGGVPADIIAAAGCTSGSCEIDCLVSSDAAACVAFNEGEGGTCTNSVCPF